MSRYGVRSYGLRAPFIKANDNLHEIIIDTLQDEIKHGAGIDDGDIFAITESAVARAQGNFASVRSVAQDMQEKFNGNTLGVVYPIMSRNRFSEILNAASIAFDKVVVQLAYPSDEQGNHLMPAHALYDRGINPYKDSFTTAQYRETFGYDFKHPFTGLDYIDLYRNLSNNIDVVVSNDTDYIFRYTGNVLVSNVHGRELTKRQLRANENAKTILGLDDIVNTPAFGQLIPHRGYTDRYGLIGSNKSAPGVLKLYPHDRQAFVEQVQDDVLTYFGKKIEVLLCGDGMFKCPVSYIWEFADPLIEDGFTSGLAGTPSQIKMKYEIDRLKSLGKTDDEVKAEIEKMVTDENKQAAQGTTPRRHIDLIATLKDATTGSGDQGTPFVLIKGYFGNYFTNQK